MFFVASKVLFFLLNPVFWILAGILLALIFRKKARLLTFFLLFTLFITVFFSNTAIFTYFVKKWEIPSQAPSKIKEKYEYAIVLGGMASVDKTGKVHISQAIDRILTAIELYKKGQIKKIVITGGSGQLLGNEKKEAPVLEEFCINMGIAKEDLIIEPNSRNTHENAVFTKKIIGIPKEKTLLITSSFHMKRSKACFKKQGFVFDVLATDPLAEPEIYIDDYFLPKPENLLKWNYLIKEWVGFYAYKMAGYI